MGFDETYQDIPRIYTAIAEMLACSIYWFILPKRVKDTAKWILYTVLFLVVDGAWLVLTDNVPDALWIPCMLVAITLMMFYVQNCIKGPFEGILYTTLKALLVAEFMASLEWQLEYYFRFALGKRQWAHFLLLIGIYLVTTYVVYRIERSMHQGDFRLEISLRELIPVMLIVLLAFLASNLSFVYQNTPFSGRLISDIFNIRTLVDLVGLALIYAYQSRAYELTAERELSSINNMLKAQYEHYRNYQDSINLINFKYHDLKHQLVGLRAEMDPEKRNAWIDTMTKELEAYKPETQTGNRVLDGVLDQKMAVIRNNQIKFTCVADGKLLDFMHVTDICTIFGNALDNAIENVVTLEDPEKRLIHMSVAPRKQFVYIEVDDYCDHEVKFRRGFPVTTKKDNDYHGFGVKSIAYTAEKYGGNVNFDMHNNTFEMKILIPIPQDAAARP